MRRALTVLGAVAGLILLPAAAASAHPLGNFTVNTYSGLRIAPDAVTVDTVVDMAEIPTFQERQSTVDADHDGVVSAAEQAAYGVSACGRLAGAARLTVAGVAVPLAVARSSVGFPSGQAGLPTLRLNCLLRAPADLGKPAPVTYRMSAYTDRVGWREITAVGDRATLTSTDVPSASASARLTAYPADLLSTPLDLRTATLRVRPGGPALAPAAGAADAPTAPPTRGVDRLTRSFTALVARHDLTIPFGLLATLLAVVLGALHAFAPGHGKTVMAAFLLGRPEGPAGRRKAWRQAASIGLTVTATHTAGVMVLGLALVGSVSVAPQRVYPWLGLASGLLLAMVGLSLVRRPARRHHQYGPGGHTHTHGLRPKREHSHGHGDAYAGGHVHASDPSHAHDFHAAGHGHDHSHPRAYAHAHSGDSAHRPSASRHAEPSYARTSAGAVGQLDHTHDEHPSPNNVDHPCRDRPNRPQPPDERVTVGRGRLLTMGLVGGLVPSPSALVVLLGAVALGRTWFGVLLVVSYGAGMAACLVGLGALLARGGHLLRRANRGPWAHRLGTALPLLTSMVIVVVGAGLAARAAAALLSQ